MRIPHIKLKKPRSFAIFCILLQTGANRTIQHLDRAGHRVNFDSDQATASIFNTETENYIQAMQRKFNVSSI